MFSLSIIISPLVGLSRPPKRFKSVDLPLPEGPRITTSSPLLIVKLRLFAALTIWVPVLYSFETFFSSIKLSLNVIK